jgi:osmoprotectant transport system permease protein
VSGRPSLFIVGALAFAVSANAETRADMVVGSKQFTESVVLGELSCHLARARGGSCHHRRELGGSRILWDALLGKELDVYPEYTGTLLFELLQKDNLKRSEELESALAQRGLAMSKPLGFNNTYALGVLRSLAERLKLSRISQLAQHPGLRLGFSHEFMDRQDGFPNLSRTYGLDKLSVRGLDHDLSYRALAAGEIDAMELYSTDAEISFYDLVTLEDDLHAFPEYRAVWLYRQEWADRHPSLLSALKLAEGALSEEEMSAMNARAKGDRVAEAQVAADFASSKWGTQNATEPVGAAQRILQRTKEHLLLTLLSLAAALVVGIPAGILSARSPKLGEGVLGVLGVVQTIPSLALLVLMIPLLGIGEQPAIAALFLYSLLPIVRNTFTGLHQIPAHIRESAVALGLPARVRLFQIDLPLASPSILAGIKTSAVLNVGTATLGALVGAGGYGQPILSGIRLADVGLILEGAVPSAALALAVQLSFNASERFLVPASLRTSSKPV